MIDSLTIKEFFEQYESVTGVQLELLKNLPSSYVFKDVLTSENIKRIFLLKYGNREIFFPIPYVDVASLNGLKSSIDWYLLGVIADNEYKYTTLYNSTKFEYIPLNNATLEETVTVTTDMSNIQEENTDIHTTTETLGATNEVDTDLEQKTSFESDNFNDTVKNTNSRTSQQVVNTTVLRDEVGGDVTKDVGTVTTVSERHGSIGVITNQDMIEKERNVANFSFINMVAFDLVKAITYSCY